MAEMSYRELIKRLKMSQKEAATFLGVSLRSSHAYANGEPVPLGFMKLLRLILLTGLDSRDIDVIGSHNITIRYQAKDYFEFSSEDWITRHG